MTVRKAAQQKHETAVPASDATFALWIDFHDRQDVVDSAMIKARLPATPDVIAPLQYLGLADGDNAYKHANFIFGRRYEGGGAWSYVKGIQWSPRTFLIGDGLEIERGALVLHDVYAAYRSGEKCELGEVNRTVLVLPMDKNVICLAENVEHCWETIFKEATDGDDPPRSHVRKNLKQFENSYAHRFRKWTDQDEIELDGLELFRFAKHFAKWMNRG